MLHPSGGGQTVRSLMLDDGSDESVIAIALEQTASTSHGFGDWPGLHQYHSTVY